MFRTLGVPIVVLLGVAGAWAAPFSVTVPTGDVPTVFKAINTASGEEWTAPGFDREFLTIIVTDVEPEALRTKIADTLGAEWRQEDGRWTLYRNSAKLKELRDQDVARLAPKLQEQLDKLKPLTANLNAEELQKLIDGDIALREARTDPTQYDWQAAQRLREQSPGQRVIANMVAQISAAELITMPASARFVYTLGGGPRQRRLPPACATILQRGLRDEAWLKQRRVSTGEQESIDFGIFGQLPAEGTPWFISITNSGFGGLECSFNSIMTFENRAAIVSRNSNWSFNAIPNEPPKAAAEDAPGADIPIQLTENELKFTEFVKRQSSAMGGESPEVENLFQLFGEGEPYAFVWDSVLQALAKHRDLDIVANPDILSWYLLSYLIAQTPEPNIAGAAAMIDGPYSRTSLAEGWLTIQPLRSAALASPEPERSAVSKFYAIFSSGAEPTAMEVARFVAESKSDEYINIGILPLMFARSNFPTLAALTSPSGWKGYRIIGSLSNSQLEVLRSGREVPVSQLSSNMKGMLDDWFYSDWISQVRPGSTRDDEYSMYGNTNPGEPTFLFPNGLPRDATLSVSGTESPSALVKVRSTAGGVYEQTMNASTLAWSLADTSPNRNIVISMIPVTQSNEKYSLRAGDYERVVVLADQSYPSGREPRALSEMPEEFRKQVESLVAEYRRSNIGNAAPPTGNRRP